MLIITLSILGGLVGLFLGGEILVRGAVALSRSLGLSTLLIGLTVVAFGTSSPELVISIQAAIQNHPDIALGNVIGSNIANIFFVLGLAALICPIHIDKKIAAFDGFFMLMLSIALIVMAISGSSINNIEGSLLVVLIFIYVGTSLWKAKRAQSRLPNDQVDEIEEQLAIPMNTPIAIGFAAGGIILLVAGAHFLVSGAVGLAEHFGIAEGVIGVTLVALGSSAPELATSIIAAYRKHSDIVLGNIVGSNIFNIAGILGATSLVRVIPVAPEFMAVDLWVAGGSALALYAVFKYLNKIHRITGALFILSYVVYISSQF
jgi:cation:H+ antiporter